MTKLSPEKVERVLTCVAKLKHPMVDEQGVHVGRFCQEERDEAAALLLHLLESTNGPTR